MQRDPQVSRPQAIPVPPVGSSAFPPIAEYGFISDCETTAVALTLTSDTHLALINALMHRIEAERAGGAPMASGGDTSLSPQSA